MKSLVAAFLDRRKAAHPDKAHVITAPNAPMVGAQLKRLEAELGGREPLIQAMDTYFSCQDAFVVERVHVFELFVTQIARWAPAVELPRERVERPRGTKRTTEEQLAHLEEIAALRLRQGYGREMVAMGLRAARAQVTE